MLKAIALLIRLDLRDRYSSLWALIGETLAVAAGLLIYSYTAKAFAPALGTQSSDYFSFILVGELVMLVPLQLLENMTRNVRQLAAQGTIDPILMLPSRPQVAPVLLSMMTLPRDVARILLTLTLACFVFGMPISLKGAMIAALLQLMAIPAFIGFSMLACAALLCLGRGYGMLTYLTAGGAVIAGAYFPTTVLPELLQDVGQYSPLNVLLESSRLALSGKPGASQCAWALAKWGLLSLPLGYLCFGFSLNYLKRRGEPLLFTA